MIQSPSTTQVSAQQATKRNAEERYQEYRNDRDKLSDRQALKRSQQASADNRAASDARTRQPPQQQSQSRLPLQSAPPSREDGELFSALLGDDEPRVPFQLEQQSSGQDRGFAGLMETQNDSQASGTMLWQVLEPELSAPLEAAPPSDFSIAMLLPKLGQVQADFQRLGDAGWEIALRFQPAALAALRPHRERCSLSLRQRLDKPVRLRFSVLEQESETV